LKRRSRRRYPIKRVKPRGRALFGIGEIRMNGPIGKARYGE
jgi:hypothetical protein